MLSKAGTQYMVIDLGGMTHLDKFYIFGNILKFRFICLTLKMDISGSIQFTFNSGVLSL
jgi:hypothetical protein